MPEGTGDGVGWAYIDYPTPTSTNFNFTTTRWIEDAEWNEYINNLEEMAIFDDVVTDKMKKLGIGKRIANKGGG